MSDDVQPQLATHASCIGGLSPNPDLLDGRIAWIRSLILWGSGLGWGVRAFETARICLRASYLPELTFGVGAWGRGLFEMQM
jgi:hypothetical protein